MFTIYLQWQILDIILETFVEIKKELLMQNIEKIHNIHKMNDISYMSSFIKPSTMFVYRDEDQPKVNIEEIP